MKYNRIAFFSLLAFCINFNVKPTYGQWTQMSSGITSNIYSVEYGASGYVWAGTFLGILHSTNYGGTFVYKSGFDATTGLGIVGDFTEIHASSSTDAVSSGFFWGTSEYIIYGSSNSGNSWVQNFYSNTGPTIKYANGIAFNNSGNGVVVGTDGRVCYSTNGGASWTVTTMGTSMDIYDVEWVSGNLFIAATNTAIYRSNNGGASWSVVNYLNSGYDHISFAPSTGVGYISRYNQLIKSTNSGVNWSVVNSPAGGLITAVECLSPDTVLLATEDHLYRSVTGGLYWESFPIGGYQSINEIEFYDANNGVAVGDSGYIIKTMNAGGGTLPVSLFSLPAPGYCVGGNAVPVNQSNPVYTFQWFYDGIFQSSLPSPVIPLSSAGLHTISLVSDNGFGTDTLSLTVNVNSPPVVQPFIVQNDTICKKGTGHFTIVNSATGTLYRLYDGLSIVGSTVNGNGGAIVLTTLPNQTVVKPYKIRAIKSVPCGLSDTLDVMDSLCILGYSPTTSAELYRDTVCSGDTTSILVYNSIQNFEYYLTSVPQNKITGTGGTIRIPVPAITANVVLRVAYSEPNYGCLDTFPNSFLLTYQNTYFDIQPVYGVAALGQPFSISSTVSGFDSVAWNFGVNANPSSYSGFNPPPITFNAQSIDTVIATAYFGNTCAVDYPYPVRVAVSIPSLVVSNCEVDLIGPNSIVQDASHRMRLDQYNNRYYIGYDTYSGTNPDRFIPYITKIDSAGNEVFNERIYSTYSTAQGLMSALAVDQFGNSYVALHYSGSSFCEYRGHKMVAPNMLIKIGPSGDFIWAIESPFAEFTDMVTVDSNRILVIGKNVWTGCSFLTPHGPYVYKSTLNNKGEAFVMELDGSGQVLKLDAFGSTGSTGYSELLSFFTNYPMGTVSQDSLRQNLQAKLSVNGDLLLCGLINFPQVVQPIKFASDTLSNPFASGLTGQKGLFLSRYNRQTGFFASMNVLKGKISYIHELAEDATGNVYVCGRAKDSLVGLNYKYTTPFPFGGSEFGFLASISASGNINWMIQGIGVEFFDVGINNDQTLTLFANCLQPLYLEDGLYHPFVTALQGTYLIRIAGNGAILGAERNGSYNQTGFAEQDICGNYHFSAPNYVMYVYSLSGNCSANCYGGYNPNGLDANLLGIYLDDITTNGPATRAISIKIENRSTLDINAAQINYQVNSDPVQAVPLTGIILSTDTAIVNLTSYTFSKTYNRIKVWLSQINGGQDDHASNDTAVISQIVCLTPMSGTYSLGCDTCYFDSFSSSGNSLRACGVNGPVLISVEPGEYLDQLYIDTIAGVSANDSVIWTSAAHDAHSVVLDLNPLGYSTRSTVYFGTGWYLSLTDLTIKNSMPEPRSVALSYERAVVEMNIRAKGVYLRNNIFYGAEENILLGGANHIVKIGRQCSDITITDNVFVGGKTGLNISSVSSSRNSRIRVVGNIFEQNQGIYAYYTNNIIVSGNTLKCSAPDFTGGTAINLYRCDTLIVTNNFVASEGKDYSGLEISYCNGTSSLPCLVYNNMFSSYTPYNSIPASFNNSSNFNIVNNSFGNGIDFSGVSSFRFLNNLVRSNSLFVISHSNSNSFLSFNYNRYKSMGFPLNFSDGGTNYTLAGWRTLTGFDLQSDSVSTLFRTLTDLHLLNSVVMTGINWPGISLDLDGEPRSAISPTIGADEYSSVFDFSDVWPGDCDSSRSVDNFDILPIGLNFNNYQTSRPRISNSWQAETSRLWTQYQGNGLNLHHVDCNGDGWINADDTLAVTLNYGLSYALPPPAPQRPLVGPPLSISGNGASYVFGDTVILKIYAGDAGNPISDLGALGFQVLVPQTLYKPGTLSVNFETNWMCADLNCLDYSRVNQATGLVAVSMARIDGMGVSGYGEIAELKFVLDSNYTGTNHPVVGFGTYQSYDPTAGILPLTLVDGTFNISSVGEPELSGFNGSSLAPNPAGPTTFLRYGWNGINTETLYLTIYDVMGRRVGSFQTLNPKMGLNEVEIDCNHLTPGLYLIELRSDQHRIVTRLIHY